jgi:general secretion pathway protein A
VPPPVSAALAAASAAIAAFEDPPPVAASDEPVAPATASAALVPGLAGNAGPCELFYGLVEKPFDPAPDPRFNFPAPAHDGILRDLRAAIDRHDGSILLTGAFGAGKTTLSRALVTLLGRRTLVSFAGHATSARDLLCTVLVDFGVLSRTDAARDRLRDAAAAELASTLREFLASLSALQAVALIIIDDAHTLPPAVLAELCVLADMAAESRLLQVLLAGEPVLAATLRRPELQPWAKRIGLRAEVPPLGPDDLAGYVAHRLGVAGTTDSVFNPAALERLLGLSRGLPHDINEICERALVLGHRASSRSIDARLVDRAARDLGLVADGRPTPWRGRLLVGGLMLALMLAGAAGAGYVFREHLTRTLARWHVLPGQ